LRTLYTIIYLHLLPLFVLRLYWRSRKAPAYRLRITERFALIPRRKDTSPLIWVHAVSVGEVIAATPMIKRLQQKYPDYRFCITTTTPTGSERVRSAFGEAVLHYYLPYDLPSLITFFIRAIKPRLLVVMETELWPNVIATCATMNIPIVLANGRMSKASAKGYKKFSLITAPMLQMIDVIAAQSKMDAERFIYLGANRAKVNVTGSIKFDVAIDTAVQERTRSLGSQLQCHDRKIVIFSSTHPGEDEQILPMIKRLYQLDPRFLAIVVPRHPERFDVVDQVARQINIATVRLSEGMACSGTTQMVLGDTMGDMLALYGLADVAFIGGSLIAHGGHNFLEAAAWGLPILTGPSVFNFQDIAKMLIKEGGLRQLHDHFDLERTLQAWLEGKLSLDDVGLAAQRVLVNNQGTLTKLIDIIDDAIEKGKIGKFYKAS
jgi:3-deoxy-D-manno-octulosonic-acid transferase